MASAISLVLDNQPPVAVPWENFKMPPFPQVALKVVQLAGNENVQFKRLSDLVGTDPGFASEILTIANSFLYAPRYPIKTVMQAIEVLGVEHLQGLCLTVGVRSYLGRSLRYPAMRTLWRHNLACALIAEQVASAGTMARDVAYTTGILHDIGRLALAVVRPAEYVDLLGRHVGNSASILDREREVFGMDHCQIGELLVEQWKLPEDFIPIMGRHHDQPLFNGQWGMPELLNLSCRMADAAGYAAFPACYSAPFSELVEELPARERNLFHTDVETLSFEVSKKIAAIEAS
jgi:putative nucleotidyltransferase with HDIG domain